MKKLICLLLLLISGVAYSQQYWVPNSGEAAQRLFERPSNPICQNNVGQVFYKNDDKFYFMDANCNVFEMNAEGVMPQPVSVIITGITVATFDGDNTDYDTANTSCHDEYAGSHVCSVADIFTAKNQHPETIPESGSAWVNGGPPGYTADANDCLGWSSAALGDYGRYWDFSIDQGWMRGCVNSLPYVCCDYQ